MIGLASLITGKFEPYRPVPSSRVSRGSSGPMRRWDRWRRNRRRPVANGGPWRPSPAGRSSSARSWCWRHPVLHALDVRTFRVRCGRLRGHGGRRGALPGSNRLHAVNENSTAQGVALHPVVRSQRFGRNRVAHRVRNHHATGGDRLPGHWYAQQRRRF